MENVIDLTEYEDDCVIESVIFTTNNINNYDHLKRENLLFCKILEKCLNLENSEGMLALINQKLVVCYNRLENSVKTSVKIETAFKETLDKLNNDPHHKCTHIKHLCNVLSDWSKKKRVKLITLDKNVTANKFSMLSCKRPKADQKNNLNTCKKPKTNEDEIKKSTSSLECDQSNNIEVIDNLNPICEGKAKEAEVIHNGACNFKTCSDLSNLNVPDESVELNPKSNSLNIEKNIDIRNNIEICPQSIDTQNYQENHLNKQTNNDERKVLEPSLSIESIPTNHLDKENLKETEKEVTLNDKDKLDEHINLSNESRDENKLLKPIKSLEFSLTNNLNTKEKIKELEKKIAICKRKIAKLDEQEVCNDSKRSPYMRSEKLKAEIVMLYQELCQLTGEHPVRRRQVQIKAIEGHPSGPLKRLETFLNDNIGSDGQPPFPNFREVVKCVLVANKEDNLGWSKAKVMDEARALFSYCGRALQKRRQKREYEDLLSKVDTCDEDPADHDAELRAKLEANKQIAIKRELEVLQKFSMMQNQSDKVGDEEDIFSDSDTDESFPNPNTIDNNELIENKDINMNEEKVPDTDSNDINIVKIKEEPEENIKDNQSGDNFKNNAVDNENRIVIEISDSSDEESSCKYSMMQNQSDEVGDDEKIFSDSCTDEKFDAKAIDNNELIENKDNKIQEEPKNIEDNQFADNFKNSAVDNEDRSMIEISDFSDKEQS